MGFPSPAKDYHQNRISLDDLIIKNESATYFWKGNTDAMAGDGIFENSLLVIDRSLTARNNDIIVATVDGENILRRLVINIDEVYLFASNPKYKPIKINGSLNVWGVVAAVVSNPNNIGYVCLG